MSTRSAEASIKGYNYQFLHTIYDILDANNDDEFTVEGIEDLDIENADEKELIQYKYHESKKYLPSEVDKPIGLMFNHFLKNQDSAIKYKLFAYFAEKEEEQLDSDSLKYILGLSKAKKAIDDGIYRLINDEELRKKFLGKFEINFTSKYEEVEAGIILKFEENFSLTNEESKIIYLANSVKIINDLAIQPDEDKRKITRRDFIEKLESLKNKLYYSYIFKEKGIASFKKVIKNQKQAYNIKKMSSTYVVQIGNYKREKITELIINLVKKFYYKGNKENYKPLVVILDCEKEKYLEVKKSIHKAILSLREALVINDGNEDYFFNELIFNMEPITTKRPLRSKVNQVNYNFKLLHKEMYEANQSKIILSNPCLFVVDESTFSLTGNFSSNFYLNNLSNEDILEIIGVE